MKFNLKNVPACQDPVDCTILDWFRGFEAELRHQIVEHQNDSIALKERRELHSSEYVARNEASINKIKEILGE